MTNNISSNEYITLNNLTDPDINFFSSINFETQIFKISEAKTYLQQRVSNSFSLLNINIRSFNKNFENFKLMLQNLRFSFKIICVTETWCKNQNSSMFDLPGYRSVHQERAGQTSGGGVSLFVHNSIDFKIRNDLSINNVDCESISIEILNKHSKNIIASVIYRQPAGNFDNFKQYFKTCMSKVNNSNKLFYTAGDFNLNILDENSNKVKRFVNMLLQLGVVPTITKATRITNTSTTLIDNIITNNFNSDSKFATGIIQTDISDHFPNFLLTDNDNCDMQGNSQNAIFKRFFDKSSTNNFRNSLLEANWELVKEASEVHAAYEVFLKIFQKLYDKHFPKIKVSINPKNNSSPWMTKALLKSSKKKQRLYQKLLKNRTYKNEKDYKNYKNTFEKLKKHAKKNYFSEQITKANGDAKKTWSGLKEIINKTKSKANSFPKSLILNDHQIHNKSEIATKLNDFFTNVGTDLAEKIPPSNVSCKTYLSECNSEMSYTELTFEELRKACSSLKSNKSPGIDEIGVNIVKQVYDIIEPTLHYIFELSLKSGVFPDQLKIAKITPIYKSGEQTCVENYRPISVLPCFSKILEKIMYDRVFSYLSENEILYKKQFGFQRHHSTDHAVMELVSEITNSFDNNNFTLGVFIDLSKAFDTVDHTILLSKLQHYGICKTNLEWFKNYLSNRKQGLHYDGNMTELKRIKCGVPQGSILGPLLFLLYVNDLPNSSHLLDFILFADDTNLFYTDSNINSMFQTVNQELKNINEWFKANKLSLNINKTKYTFFTKQSNIDNIPLVLPILKINNVTIKRVNTMKFLGVVLDESLTFKYHIEIIENKISKNLGILYKAKPYLNITCLKTLYFSFINSYLNYCNISWGSNNSSKLKKIFNKQKHAIRIVFGKSRHTPTEELFRALGALNIYEINIFQVAQFMFKFKTKTLPKIFENQFTNIEHRYPTRFSVNNYRIPKTKLKRTAYAIRYRGPYVWDYFVEEKEKGKTSLHSFKSKLKKRLLKCSISEYCKYF